MFCNDSTKEEKKNKEASKQKKSVGECTTPKT
jgi:hypothetical protein